MTEMTLRSVEVREGVGPEEFQEDILPAGQPVLLRGAVSDWPSVAAGRDSVEAAADYLARFDAGKPVETIFGPREIKGHFFYNDDMKSLNFERRPERLAASLGALKNSLGTDEAATVYIQSLQVPPHLPGFVDENAFSLVPPGIAPRIWIGNRLTVQTHFDLSHNLACLVAGRRRFTLFPPDQTPNLYPGPFEFTLAGAPVSMVRLESPDYERYPKFREALAAGLVADMEPGDALFVPYFWWHHVRSLDAFNILVNYWWNDAGPELGAPLNALLHSILSIRDLPSQQKAAWRTMFEHYVFEDPDGAVAHLPPHARGALGPHTVQMKKNLWNMLGQAIAKTVTLLNRPRS